jgi:arylsulfatase A-like enzyme
MSQNQPRDLPQPRKALEQDANRLDERMPANPLDNKPSRRDFLKVSGGALAAMAAAGPPPARRAAGPPPDVIQVDNAILIITDSMRRDALSLYGANWIRTPYLDRFARQALVFENSYTSSFPTVPLRNDVLTGRYTFTFKDWSPIDPDAVTLQETLGRAGILTALVVDTPHPFAPGYNYQRGFDSWQINRGQEGDRFRTAPREVKLPCHPRKLRQGRETVTKYLRNVARRQREEDYFVAETMTKAAEWLEENHDGRRFFLYVDTFDPHEPWDPPRYYSDPYDPGYEGEEVIYPRYDYWREFLTERELQHCRALYAGEVTMVDRWIGFLLERVASLGLLQNTAVFITSDHGFYLGEHDLIGKSLIRESVFQYLPLYPEVARIPLLVYFPGCAAGSRVKALAQPVDLMPTVLDLLGVAKPPSVEGSSLEPVLQGKTASAKDLVISSPPLFGAAKSPPSPTTRSSISDGEWLLIYGAQSEGTARSSQTSAVDSIAREVRNLQGEIRPELYHVAEDPGCKKNVISERHQTAENLRAAYLDFLRRRGYPRDFMQRFRPL